jgi:23S rRNA (guanine2445-N2)-methyltransferase / 23S rRNA (guanine2069-N7)-methyltransferase
VKQRRQQKGLQQYERQDQTKQWLEVQEGDAIIGVNLTDYLDTGLFLDHRPARLWLHQEASQQRVLNLFSYTCVAGLQAALGGAESVTNVDLSKTYLRWGERNFKRNGIARSRSEFIQADIMAWLQEQTQQWDLIFLDPPTFSNSARMTDHFDVQRDHLELIRNAMRCLAPAGKLLFSTNFKRFKLDPLLLETYQVESWQAASIPPDFVRTPNIHACWMLRHR